MKSKIIFSLAILSCASTFISAQNSIVKPNAKTFKPNHLKKISFSSIKPDLLNIYNDTSEPVRVSNGDGAELIIEPQSIHQFGLICNEPIKSKEITLFLSHPTYTQVIYLVVPVKYDERAMTIGDLEKHSVSLLISKLFKEA